METLPEKDGKDKIRFLEFLCKIHIRNSLGWRREQFDYALRGAAGQWPSQ